jgi:hypothetical protein
LNPTFGREALCEFIFWRAKRLRRKEKTLGGLTSLRESIFFSQSRKDAKKLDKPLALWCEFIYFFARKVAEAQRKNHFVS